MNTNYSVGLRIGLMGLLALSLTAWARSGYAQVAPPLTTLHAFERTDGALPLAGLIQGKNGALYGAAQIGGANGSGSIFKITTGGAFTILHSFSTLDTSSWPYINADGAELVGDLIQGTDGALYGTASYGGTYGNGTVFKLNIDGSAFKVLYTFSAMFDGSSYANPDGAYPSAGLIQGKDGNLYGTTYYGGANGNGTVFKITTTGVMTPLHSFSALDSNGNNTDGATLRTALIQARNGLLYGTTEGGGVNGGGTVFKITTTGAFTTLHSFNFTDGAGPRAGLMQAKNGVLYGTTEGGGVNDNGTVFKITTAGTLTSLYSFSALDDNGNNADGASPLAGLIQGTDGNLYGTTVYGGATDYGDGTVFRITASGVLSTFHTFSDTDGAFPFDHLLLAKDGNLYGTTARGEADNAGTVFKLTMTPLISSFSPHSGPIGTSITLTGVNFTHATAVEVGVLAAKFTLHSDTSIILVVPTGAKTARITVVNAFGNGYSKTAFKVTP